MDCQEAVNEVIAVIHNPSSVGKLLDSVRVALGFGLRNIVITKATGSAAQQGVPEAFKLAIKSGATLMVLPDLRDAVELLRPVATYLLSTRGEPLDSVSGRSLLVMNASDQPFTPSELNLGRQVRVVGRDVGGTALLTLALYKLMGKCIE
ncbi:RecB-family nuclease [Vulcanisaeta thermophila]|uniref:RecB-family nuclease n=1 Tax=Vulcanisaeta thermophila TaxID=867917 RepID=UPI000853A926|nr:RecB-family nuclease [Vulcanisaeta thermophila]